MLFRGSPATLYVCVVREGTKVSMVVLGLKMVGSVGWLQATLDALDGDVGTVGVVEGRVSDAGEHVVAAAVGRHHGHCKCGLVPRQFGVWWGWGWR